MMDLFYKNVVLEYKRRVHFNEFMLNIHKFNHVHTYKKKSFDPAFRTAQKIAKTSRLLCLDEI